MVANVLAEFAAKHKSTLIVRCLMTTQLPGATSQKVQTVYVKHVQLILKENDGLVELDLQWNGFGVDGACAMGHALAHNDCLEELDLSHNRIAETDAVTADGNRIADGATALAKALVVNTKLQAFKVSLTPARSSDRRAAYVFQLGTRRSSGSIRWHVFRHEAYRTGLPGGQKFLNEVPLSDLTHRRIFVFFSLQ